MLFRKNLIKKPQPKNKTIRAASEKKNTSDISQLKKDLAAFGIKNYSPKVAPKGKKSPKTINPKTDNKKRSFLKIAGAVGLGLAATSLIPKKAQALVFGSTPASNVVGIKNAAGDRISPATEGTADLTRIAAQSTATKLSSLTFSGSNLMTVGASGSDVMGLKDAQDTRINPVTDDTVILLRRMVKLMESQATVDGANRQRVTVDAWGTNVLTGVGTSASCLRVAIGSDSNIGTIGSYAAQQMYGDVAHDVYANAIRRNLTFTSSV